MEEHKSVASSETETAPLFWERKLRYKIQRQNMFYMVCTVAKYKEIWKTKCFWQFGKAHMGNSGTRNMSHWVTINLYGELPSFHMNTTTAEKPKETINIARGTMEPGYRVYSLNSFSIWNQLDMVLREEELFRHWYIYWPSQMAPLALVA